MKKTLVMALSAALALSAVTPVFAYNGAYDNGNDNGYYDGYYNGYENGYEYDYYTEDAYEEEEKVAFHRTPSKVGNIEYYEYDRLTVDGTILLIGPETVIVDATTGQPGSIADRTTDRVKVYHSAIQTRSYPPLTPALVVAINLPEYAMGPHLHVIEEIYEVDDNTVRLTVDGGGLHLTINEETPLNPHLTRQWIGIEHLQVGDTLLFWYEAVAMSFPGQATPSRVLWLSSKPSEDSDIEFAPEPYKPYEPEYKVETPTEYATPEPEYKPETPDLTVPAVPGVYRDGVQFFPVRAKAVNAGFNVAWDSASNAAVLSFEGDNAKTITIANGASYFTVTQGEYTVTAALPAGAFIEDGTMFAPYSFFAAVVR